MFNQVVMCVYTRVTEVPKLPRVSQISCEGTTGGKELSPSGQQAAELRVVFEGLFLRLFLKYFLLLYWMFLRKCYLKI